LNNFKANRIPALGQTFSLPGESSHSKVPFICGGNDESKKPFPTCWQYMARDNKWIETGKWHMARHNSCYAFDENTNRNVIQENSAT
jgi:hypothetical protein